MQCKYRLFHHENNVTEIYILSNKMLELHVDTHIFLISLFLLKLHRGLIYKIMLGGAGNLK